MPYSGPRGIRVKRPRTPRSPAASGRAGGCPPGPVFDTADAYGRGENETFLSSFVGAHRDDLVLAT
ncbi:hypothetical protein AB0885_42685, partial [Streptomyces sp. NPDC005534]|uniref:hypothetical protein n=1 Tax=Streptomyces sp. NPDC005534 TaxID=3155714 RepID=UPI003455D185